MKIEKEGLHVYGVETSVSNEYFLAVEYPTIRHNQPETLLPVLLREQDGKSLLFYDLSDATSLATLSEEGHASGGNFSRKDCQEFLTAVRRLLEELDELMLSPVHVPILPERIYRTGEERYRFLYCPDEEHDMGAEMQQFFAWMLSEINYGDSMTVRYVYHVYWLIRNRSFSAKLIEECLDYREEEVPGITSYESFFAGADGGENPGARQQMDAPRARESRQTDAPDARGSRQTDAPRARESRQTNAPGARESRQADALDARGSRQTDAPGARESRQADAPGAQGSRQTNAPRAAKRRADRSSIPGEGTASVPSGTELYNAGRRTDRDFTRSDGQTDVHSRAASGVFRAVGMVLAIAAALTGVLTAAAGIYFLGRGMLPVYNRYWLGGVFLCILLGETAWQLLRRRRRGHASDSAADSPGPAAAGEKMENPAQKSAAFGAFWGDRDCGAADFSRAEKQGTSGFSRAGKQGAADFSRAEKQGTAGFSCTEGPGEFDFSCPGKQEAAGAVFPGDGEETVRLDLGRRGKRPALVSEESGEIIPLLHFPFYIGNDLGLNQLMICDRTVSREHAVIERGGRPGSYFIRDMHSTNGTWVGSVRLEETAAELKEGDSLRFAEHRYRFGMVEE